MPKLKKRKFLGFLAKNWRLKKKQARLTSLAISSPNSVDVDDTDTKLPVSDNAISSPNSMDVDDTDTKFPVSDKAISSPNSVDVNDTGTSLQVSDNVISSPNSVDVDDTDIKFPVSDNAISSPNSVDVDDTDIKFPVSDNAISSPIYYFDHNYASSGEPEMSQDFNSDNILPPNSNFDHDYASSRVPTSPVVSEMSNFEFEKLQLNVKMEVCSPSEMPENVSKFEKLQDDLKELCSPYVSVVREDEIEILEFYNVMRKTSVKVAISIDQTYKATILVHRKQVSDNHYLWNGLPQEFDTYTKVQQLLNTLDKFAVCLGNPDKDFQDLAPIGGDLTSNNSTEIYAYREGDFCAQSSDLVYHSSIRTVDCSLLVEGRRCNSCASYRRCLRARKLRLTEKSELANKDLIHSNYRHRDMSKEMLIAKIEQQQSCMKCLQHTVDKQKRDLDKQKQNQEVSDLVKVCRDMENAFPDPNSLQRLLWDQQLKFAKSGKNGMRWHPMIVKWCLHLQKKSSKAYEALRNSGFVNLPSARTLFDYSHYTTSALDFQGDVEKWLQEEASKKE